MKIITEAVPYWCSCSKLSGENPCQSVISIVTLQLYWNYTLAWVFSCISKEILILRNASSLWLSSQCLVYLKPMLLFYILLKDLKFRIFLTFPGNNRERDLGYICTYYKYIHNTYVYLYIYIYIICTSYTIHNIIIKYWWQKITKSRTYAKMLSAEFKSDIRNSWDVILKVLFI